MHGNRAPTEGLHPCARKVTTSDGGTKVVCRYQYPKELVDPVQAQKGVIKSDPYRAGLYNLFLARNDPLINNFEAHLLLANLGNVDWRPLINLWSVLEYLTKYSAKSGKGSQHLATLFDLWRRTISKFYNIGGP